ncbi:mediator of RNA polymerase II transcription subunit 23-like [Apium graveolens]|uniref:mediator of RNA polymerase II transcription subunit 23-like n=1 Tax=Apium graveolens TaxID=4045 RepID=UPI003D7ACE94
MRTPNDAVDADMDHHPARTAILDLFNFYLGINGSENTDDCTREPPNKSQKRVTASRVLPPCNEQFLVDFDQLMSQFSDQEQLRAVTESVLISLVIQYCSHAPRAEFLLFSISSLCSTGYINLDTFLSSLLSSVAAAELLACQGNQMVSTVLGSNLTQPGILPSSDLIPYASNFQSSNPASPLHSFHGIGSPVQLENEISSCDPSAPITSSDQTLAKQQSWTKVNMSARDNGISILRQLCCKIILDGLKFNIKPVTHAEIFHHMMNWLVNWDQRHQGSDESNCIRSWSPDKSLTECLHSCLDVIWLLVEDDKCRVPFYELLRNCLLLTENIPDDVALFAVMLEIHKRRDMMAMHMQMLDQHLHCPSFGTNRYIPQTTTSITVDQVTTMRYSPITYPSVLGEPLHGEDLAASIEKESLDWERAMRCLRHAMRNNVSPDWLKRVLVLAPSNRPNSQAPISGAVFTTEMTCEAAIDRIVELVKLTKSVPDVDSWHEWLLFADLFYFLVKSGCLNLFDFVDKFVAHLADHQIILKTNHVTWLLTQIIRAEHILHASDTSPRKVKTTQKILSMHTEETSSDSSSPQSTLLEYISSCLSLRIWSLDKAMRGILNDGHFLKGKKIDEWLKQVSEGESKMDYTNMDDRSTGMFWAVSYMTGQYACDTVISWLTSGGTELLSASNLQSSDRIMVMREVNPVPVSLLSGLSIHTWLKLASQLEETIFNGQAVASIAMVETYARLLLIAPHSLFRTHLSYLTQRFPSTLNKTGPSLLLLELLNYRFLSLYRYLGKNKTLMYDVTKIIATLKRKRGEHRTFRLAENLCINLLLSLKEVFAAKKEGKGSTEFTETLNRITIMSLAISIKTRGVADADHLPYLLPMVEHILATSQHTWSEKTLRHFPSLLRNTLIGRMNKRSLAIQAWQQAETTVINQCSQLLSPAADPSYAKTYIGHSFPQHRQYLCSGAWILMQDHPENINSANLALVLREFSPEEVTANIYTMVDVMLHRLQMCQQPFQELTMKACANLADFIFTHELLPLDILFLALIDRDDDPHALRIVVSLLESQELQDKIKIYLTNVGQPEHWFFSGTFKRVELQKALGNHLSCKERFPTFFDGFASRLLPVIPLIIYRLVENEAIDAADRVLKLYSPFVHCYPLHFTFVRDILSYFYGHLPGKLILRILSVLDSSKIPFSESFPQHANASNAATSPPLEYFATLLLGIVNNVVPPLNNIKYGPGEDVHVPHKIPTTSQTGPTYAFEGQKAFYQIPDPGTYTQLILETAVIEILSLPVSPSQIVSSLIQIAVHTQPTLIQSNHCLHGASTEVCSFSQSSPTGGSGGISTSSVSEISPCKLASQSGYTSQQLSCLLIQACGLLLAQLPQEFHAQLYIEAARVIKDSWSLADGKRALRELDSAVGYALLDPTWASQDNTSTAVGTIVSLLHSFYSNLPQEWLEGTNLLIKHLRPVKSVWVLRIVFRIMGPLLPRVANSRSLFKKTLLMLLSVLVDVFGKNSQPSTPVKAADIVDIIDFLHHVVHYEGQGGPVESTSKPRAEILVLFGKVVESLRPDVQHLLSHLKPDVNTSIYAATHPNLVQNSM